MKKSLELKETRSDLVSKLEDVHAKASSEKRELSKSEAKNVDSYIAKIDSLDVDIKRAEKIESELRNAAAVSGATVSAPKADKRYSVQKAVNEYIAGNLTGIEKEYDTESRRNNTITGVGIPMMVFEQRNNPQTTANGAGMIPTEVGDFAATLQNKTVLGDKATWMYGLTGDMKLPTLSGTTAGWGTEVADATDAATVIGSSTLSPRKLSAYMDISKMLLAQTNGSVEGIIRNDIQNAIASQLEGAILGSADGSGAPPQGVYDAGTAATAAAFTRANVLALIKSLEEANADNGNVAFVMSPATKALLQALPMDVVTTSGASTPLFDADGKVMGIDGLVTQNSSTLGSGTHVNGLVLGKWDDCVIGQFGNALDVVADPYTLAISGEVRLVVLSYWDAIYRRATSFQYQYGS